MPNRLIVVANRLPQTLRLSDGHWITEASSGGLASAMKPLLQSRCGEWIGWAGDDGQGDNEERRTILKHWADTDGLIAVDLPPEVAAGFYEGYANQALWPVFHNFPSQLKFDATGWEAYVEANRIFCNTALERYHPGDMVWVHDYHLMLVPEMLRRLSPDSTVGFFLHIPFPSAVSSQSFRAVKSCSKGFWGPTSSRSKPTGICNNSVLRFFEYWAWRAKSMRSRWAAVSFG
jgi:trehalose 6-phosphate synthase/phosphatase